MNLKEAYSILEIPDGSKKEDAKKAFKKLAAKYHPDINKEPDAEAKFKKINEAWQIVDSGKLTGQDAWNNTNNGFENINFVDIQDIIGGNNIKRQFFAADVHLHQTVSFKESIIGCTKDFTYNRKAKCTNCNGTGKFKLNNNCANCAGNGVVIKRNGFAVIHQTCHVCRGKVISEPCKQCEDGAVDNEIKVTVNIPPGVKSGSVLNLGNRGNYIGDFMGMEQCTKVLLNMQVIPDRDFTVKDNDVISSIDISLLEALQGCKKTVNTIDGSKEIDIPALVKNNHEVIIPNLGVARVGNQRVVINVNYPLDSSGLITFLKKD